MVVLVVGRLWNPIFFFKTVVWFNNCVVVSLIVNSCGSSKLRFLFVCVVV